jgi:hypothetical protein
MEIQQLVLHIRRFYPSATIFFFSFFWGNRKTIIKKIRVGVGEEVGAFKG